MGQLPFPFSQTKELDESVPIAWRTTDALMPSATQVHEDNSRQPSPTTVRALNWLYALRAATKHRQQHALVDHARSRAMLWHRLYRPHIKIIWGMKCHAPSKPWMKQSLPSCLPTSRWNKNCLNIISWVAMDGACTQGPARQRQAHVGQSYLAAFVKSRQHETHQHGIMSGKLSIKMLLNSGCAMSHGAHLHLNGLSPTENRCVFNQNLLQSISLLPFFPFIFPSRSRCFVFLLDQRRFWHRKIPQVNPTNHS